jgi:hypothetical protein
MRSYIVWIPMIDEDERSEVPSASRNVAVSPQYFDSKSVVARGLSRALDVNIPIWDTFYFYPPGAVWGEKGLPLPETALIQINSVVVGTPGTLPAIADQAMLPKQLKGKAVVVGDQDNFEALLWKVAEPFATKFAKK